MSSEPACRTVASASRVTFRHRDGDDRLLTLRSPLSKRRGDISRGTALLQPGCPIYREDTFAAGKCFSPLHCEGRGNRAVRFARSRRKLVATLSQGVPRFAPKLFSVDRTGRED